MNTTESNKLIAEFLGSYQQYSWSYNLNCWLYNHTKIAYADSNGEFHSNWNWLMGVINKIYETDEYYNQYILYNSSLISDGKIKITASIVKDYEQVLDFVKWYKKEQANRAIQDSIDLNEWSD